MDNLSKIKKFSTWFYLLLTYLLYVIPAYYVFFWVFVNHLPATLITVNMDSKGLMAQPLPPLLQVAGFVACLFPLAALTYGIANMRKLFSYYKSGTIFSFAHVRLFRNTAKALLFWVIFSVLYESAKSVLFTIGNPPGSRMISVGFGSSEFTTLVVGGVVFFIAWVMDEGRILTEETELTV